jgi:hypothetical protein
VLNSQTLRRNLVKVKYRVKIWDHTSPLELRWVVQRKVVGFLGFGIWRLANACTYTFFGATNLRMELEKEEADEDQNQRIG